MTITEVLESVQYVVNSEGRKTAVQLDLSAWEMLRPLVEELIEDGRLGHLMETVADDETLDEAAAQKLYQEYLSKA